MFDRTKRFTKRSTDVKTFSGYEDLKQNTILFMDFAKRVFQIERPTRKETFEEAQERFDLQEEDIQQKQNTFYRLSMMFLAVAFGAILYSFYILYLGHLASFALCWAVIFVLLVQAFRYHFWFFQLKQRKLGCTIKEWWNSDIKGDVK